MNTSLEFNSYHSGNACGARITDKAFTLIEVLIGIAVLAVVAAIGVMAMSGVTDGSKKEKLNSDVGSLNGAVQMYLASGGDLSGAATPNDVLAKMKTVVTAAQSKRQINPLTGSMIDRRLVAEMQTAAEAATGEPRVHWISADKVFVVGSSGGVGVKRFILDEALASVAIKTESRNSGSMQFASTSGWVWDNKNDWRTDASLVPTGVHTNPFPSPPLPPVTTAGGATAGATTAGTATAGSATAGSATTGTSTSGTATSGTATGGTPPTPPRLPTPVLNPAGGPFLTSTYPMSVTIVNAGTYAGNGILKYQVNSGPWVNYLSSITVQPDQTVRTQAFAIDPTAYRDSYQKSEYYYAVASSFAGNTVGWFNAVSGGNNLIYTLSEGGSFLSHGSPEIDLGDGTIVIAGEANTMKFLTSNFSGVLPGQEFLLGEILYHNGTTFDSSHADRARLSIDIFFTTPVVKQRINIQLDLVNTENTSDPDASADYVKFRDVNETYTVVVGGATYKLAVRFGTADVNGFASASQFHVYEGATARGELRGTMTIQP